MNTKSSGLHISPCSKRGKGRHVILVLTLLLIQPMTASAASIWCTWFPWLPLCNNSVSGCGEGLEEVSEFGSNPGNLKMCTYVPENLEATRPLVVALHGCTQQASDYDDETGWTKFADEHQFALLLPQQQDTNNGNKCFNWLEANDSERDKGEASSIRQMIAKMEADPASTRVHAMVAERQMGSSPRVDFLCDAEGRYSASCRALSCFGLEDAERRRAS